MTDVFLKYGLEIGTVLSLVLMAAFLIAGVAMPFLLHERRDRR